MGNQKPGKTQTYSHAFAFLHGEIKYQHRNTWTQTPFDRLIIVNEFSDEQHNPSSCENIVWHCIQKAKQDKAINGYK